jgi:hypothetical protein
MLAHSRYVRRAGSARKQARLSKTFVWPGAVGTSRPPSVDSYKRLERLCKAIAVDPLSTRRQRRRAAATTIGCYVTKAKATPKPAATMIVNTKSGNCQRGGRASQLFGPCGFMARPFATLLPAREDQRGWRNIANSLLI